MKKFFIIPILFLVLILFAKPCCAAEYNFNFSEEGSPAKNEIDEFINSLPNDIREKTTDISMNNANEAAEKYNLNFFLSELVSTVNTYLPSATSLFGVISSMIILTTVFNNLSSSLNNTGCQKAFRLCSVLCIVLAVYTLRNGSYKIASDMLSTLSSVMNLMVPIMEAIYISAGNTSLAAVTATGMSILLSVTENLYAKVLTPAVTVSFILSCISAATDNKGISFLSKSLRTVMTTAIIFITSMISIVLSLQTSLSASADKFAARAVRFALGNYIPLVGGAVSESLSAFSGSLGIIKQLAGTTGIVVIILMLLPPIVSMLLTRISIYCSGVVAAMLGCDKEKTLLDDIGGTYTMLICITLCAAISFVYAISLFCKASLALA